MQVPKIAADRSRDANASVYYIECGHYNNAQRRDNWALQPLQAEIEEKCGELYGIFDIALTLYLVPDSFFFGSA